MNDLIKDIYDNMDAKGMCSPAKRFLNGLDSDVTPLYLVTHVMNKAVYGKSYNFSDFVKTVALEYDGKYREELAKLFHEYFMSNATPEVIYALRRVIGADLLEAIIEAYKTVMMPTDTADLLVVYMISCLKRLYFNQSNPYFRGVKNVVRQNIKLFHTLLVTYDNPKAYGYLIEYLETLEEQDANI